MDLYELEKEQKILELRIVSKKERITLERSRLGSKAIDYSKPSVQSSPRKDPMLDILSKISEMEDDVTYCEAKLEQNFKEIDRLYQIFKECNDRDKQIYVEKKLYNWCNAKISVNHGGISKSQINKIIKKINNKMCNYNNDSMNLVDKNIDIYEKSMLK